MHEAAFVNTKKYLSDRRVAPRKSCTRAASVYTCLALCTISTNILTRLRKKDLNDQQTLAHDFDTTLTLTLSAPQIKLTQPNLI